MIKPIFITSTGTNIGKTYLTNLLIKRAKMLNYKIKAIKTVVKIEGELFNQFKKK